MFARLYWTVNKLFISYSDKNEGFSAFWWAIYCLYVKKIHVIYQLFSKETEKKEWHSSDTWKNIGV